MAKNLPVIPVFFERFIENWAKKKQPASYREIQIDRQRLYILPTRHGIVFFMMLLLILFGAINYENSLGFMLAFLLGSIGLLGMIYTHQNINKLNVRIGRAESVFAGQDILIPLTLTQTQNSLRPAIQLTSETGQHIHLHLINEQTITVRLPVTSQHRGYHKFQRFKLFSEYPLGLFHAWSWLNMESRCLVYPAPAPLQSHFVNTPENGSGSSNENLQGTDDFAGIRQYKEGDLVNHMAWKAIAKTGELQTKLFNTETASEIWICWSHTHETLDTEQRLSILCRMVIDASEKNLLYGLDIPGKKILPATGLAHKHSCLKALALFGPHSA